METDNKKEGLKLAYELFKDTQQDNLEYIYRGKFNTDITDNILSLAEESLRLSEQKLTIKKRVYFVMVEGLQNITRHQDITSIDFPVKPGLFVLQRKQNSYFITTGNLIEKRNIRVLQGQLELAILAYEKIVKTIASSQNMTNLSLAYVLNKQYAEALKFAQSPLT